MTSILITDGQELAGLGAARSLGRAGYHVTVAIPQGLLAPVMSSRYVAQVVESPNPWSDQPAFRQFLCEQATKHSVLLPVSEAAIVAAAACRNQLGKTTLLAPSDEALRFSLSKYHATRAAQSVGLSTPPTVFVAGEDWPLDLSSLMRELDALGYPLLIKHDNYLTPSGNYVRGRTQRVSSPLQARALLVELQEHGAQVIAQRPVDGHGAGVFLLRHNGQTLLRFAHERLHEVPYTGGVSSLRMSCHDDALLARSEQLLSAIGFDGVAMVEFRKTPSGTPQFLEINGRLWGSLALALHAQVDFPLLWLRSVLGLSVPSVRDYPDGLRCRNVLPGELSHLASVLRSREVPLTGKLRSLWEQVALSFDVSIRHDHLWYDDPRPALTQASLWAHDVGRRLWGRVGRSKQMHADKEILSQEQRDTEARFSRLPRPVRRVLVLCLGNICRSPFAEHYLRRESKERGMSGLHVESAGFLHHDGLRTPTRFVELVRSHSVDLSGHRARRVTAQQIDDADMILLMDAQNLRALHSEFPHAVHKTFLIGLLSAHGPAEIPDPYMLSIGDAEASYQKLAEACSATIRRLQPR